MCVPFVGHRNILAVRTLYLHRPPLAACILETLHVKVIYQDAMCMYEVCTRTTHQVVVDYTDVFHPSQSSTETEIRPDMSNLEDSNIRSSTEQTEQRSRTE